MKTISQKLRSLARKPFVSEWTPDDHVTHDVAYMWLRPLVLTREFGLGHFGQFDDEEWGMFLCFVAEALETQ